MSVLKAPGVLLGVSTLMTGVWSAALWAADAADTGDTLEEVVVTAEKRETNLQKTAISIQVYSGEELKKEGKKRIDDIMSGVVGVQSQGSQVGSSFYMRGVDAGGQGGTAAAVALLVDGVYQNRSEAVRGGTLDVSQVEVMRGTQSTNLGASSLAGAISLISNNPVFAYQASGNLEVGNYNLVSTEAVLNVPLADNQAVRFAYSQSKRDGYISSGAGDSDLLNARLKYRWQVSDTLDIVATANHQNIGGNGVSDGVLLYTGHWVPWDNQLSQVSGCNYTTTTTYFSYSGCPVKYVAVADGVTYKDRSNPWDDGYPAGSWPNNPFRDTNINTYSSDVNWSTPIGKFTVTPSVQDATFRSTEPPRGTSWRNENRGQVTDQVDARLASDSQSSLEWLAGLYYYYTNTWGTYQTVNFPGASSAGVNDCSTSSDYCYSWQDTKYSKQESESAYTDLTWHMTDVLRLKGGLRYSHDTKKAASTGDTAGDVAGATAAYDYIQQAGSWSALTYRGGVEYDLRPQSMVYAMYSTGYQPGSISTTDTTGTKKLTLQQITLGMKNRFLDDRLQVNVEAFNSRYHNRAIQGTLAPILDQNDSTVSCTVPPGSPTTVAISDTNACISYAGTAIVPNVLSRGVDLDASWLPTSADRVDLSAEVLKSVYEAAPSVPAFTGAEFLSMAGITAPTAAQSSNAATLATYWNNLVASYNGLTLQNSPKWTLNGSYEHTFTLGNGSTLVPRANVMWKSRYWTAGGPNADAANPGLSYQEAYAWYNASLGWSNADGKFSVTGNVKNITNKAVMTNYGGTTVTLDQPRTFSISLSASL